MTQREWSRNFSPNSHILYTLLFFLLFLALFTLLSIFNGQSSNGIFSKLLDHQQLNYNPVITSNIPKQDSEIEGLKIDSNPISEKPNDDYKVLGGLLVAGLKESSCLSRYRLSSLNSGGGQNSRNNRTRQPSAHLISRLRNYEARHKQCGYNTASYNKTLEILKSGGWKTKIINNDEDFACKYVIWTPLAGLGNRMITLASTFLYALLTNRVLFIVGEDNIHNLFCEPFPDVSWLLPSDFPIGDFYKLDRSCPYRYANMLKNHSIQRKSAWRHMHKKDRHKSRVPPVVYLHLTHDYNKEDKLFFCDEDQTFMQNVPWLIIKSDQYFVPALFLMQSFQQELHTLFPEKETVFHHLGRYLFHPSNSVWGLITRYYETYLAKADEMLGLQIREFHDRGNNVTFNTIFDQISSCTINRKLLPEITKKGDGLDKKTKNKVVLVTSLNSKYYDKLRETYWEYATLTGESVAFYQPSHEEEQQTGNQMHDRKALAEVYLLSMSDKLVTSGWSTFGYVAQSLGGLRPWILYTPMDEKVPDPPCQLALSMEPCFHFAPSHLECRNGKSKGNETSTIVPHVKHCEDVGMGLKLVGKND